MKDTNTADLICFGSETINLYRERISRLVGMLVSACWKDDSIRLNLKNNKLHCISPYPTRSPQTGAAEEKINWEIYLNADGLGRSYMVIACFTTYQPGRYTPTEHEDQLKRYYRVSGNTIKLVGMADSVETASYLVTRVYASLNDFLNYVLETYPGVKAEMQPFIDVGEWVRAQNS